jgi:ribonuclease HII
LSKRPNRSQEQLDLFSSSDLREPDFCYFEEEARKLGYYRVAGVDEAGRGPLAGPVVVAACILPYGIRIDGVDDSKRLSPIKRKALFDILTSHSQIVYAVEVVEPEVIDRINIFQATMLGMRQAVLKLKDQPDYVLVDGNHAPSIPMPVKAVIQGDRLSQIIAAASILAKETRDAIMVSYDEKWPQYGFAKHKGYATEEHIQTLQKYGPCPIHRRSFFPVKERIVL